MCDVWLLNDSKTVGGRVCLLRHTRAPEEEHNSLELTFALHHEGDTVYSCVAKTYSLYFPNYGILSYLELSLWFRCQTRVWQSQFICRLFFLVTNNLMAWSVHRRNINRKNTKCTKPGPASGKRLTLMPGERQRRCIRLGFRVGMHKAVLPCQLFQTGPALQAVCRCLPLRGLSDFLLTLTKPGAQGNGCCSSPILHGA